MQGEMPGFFPGRPGGEYGEPLLDMILERCPIPPGAPPEVHGLAHVLAAAAGPAEPGELTGEAVALAAFTRIGSPAGISPAVPRSARRSGPEWRARGRLSLAAALTAVAAGLGSTAAAYAGVLPGPIQHFAHEYIGAPAPHHDFSGHAPAMAGSSAHAPRGPSAVASPESHQAPSSVPDHGHSSSRNQHHGPPVSPPGRNLAGCRPPAAVTQNQGDNRNQDQEQGKPTPTPGQSQGPGQGKSQSAAGPSPKQTPQASVTSRASGWPPATACPAAGPATSSPG
jgi:hypothetical protein